MEIELFIDPEIMPVSEFKNRLETAKDLQDAGICFKSRQSEEIYRNIDATIVIAITSSLSTVIGVLIPTLFGWRKNTTIIQTKEGHRIEFRSTLKPEEIDMLIEKCRKLSSIEKIITF